jgi:putative Mn2+ efflux pump MntP
MTFPELLILALALGTDAFAAAVGRGAARHCPGLRVAAGTALYFGIAEAAMVLLGFLVGAASKGPIESIDHWVAFGLLGAIGARMIWEGLRGESPGDPADDSPKSATPMAMTLTAIGTSIDSAVIGVTLALVGAAIAVAAPVIGVTSFLMSLAGVYLGRGLGPLLGRKAEVFGGLVLIAIGTRILLEHLGATPF